MDSLNICNSVIVCRNLNTYSLIYYFLILNDYQVKILPPEKLREESDLNITVDLNKLCSYRLSENTIIKHKANEETILKRYPNLRYNFTEDIRIIEDSELLIKVLLYDLNKYIDGKT